MKSPISKTEFPASEIRGQPLPQMPVYPSGVRGYTGRASFPPSNRPSRAPGRADPPRYPLKKGGFSGASGGFPRARLDYSTTSKEHVTNGICEG
jgi:hypothetical protein